MRSNQMPCKKPDAFNTLVILSLAVLLFSALMWAGKAMSADATVLWTHPTQYTDSSPLAVEAIKETVVQYGTCVAPVAPSTTYTFGTVTKETSVPAPAATVKLTGIVAGTWCFRAKTNDMNAQSSAWSAVVRKAIAEIRPKAPTALGVTNP